ncbi:MAG: hypothetical protein J6X40_06265 [Bacteroidales bacterium]|jgi:hypothetical protein|nr:hypothetical protein [Bacteroidales bacterium]
MIGNATLNYSEPILDETFTDQIKDAFAADKRMPGKSVLSFIMGFAAAFESLESGMLGTMGVINN